MKRGVFFIVHTKLWSPFFGRSEEKRPPSASFLNGNRLTLNGLRLWDALYVYHDFSGKKKSPGELRLLCSLAQHGDAAYALYAYYAIGAGQNLRLSEKYLERAIELELPVALFNKGFQIWYQDENPDVELAFKLVSRAIELGYKRVGFPPNEQELLEILRKAKETGVVPR